MCYLYELVSTYVLFIWTS